MTREDFEGSEVCIYCLGTSGDKEFDREHIIPANIGGALFADGLVCKCCNSTLGHSVDQELLNVPEILTAMDDLGIQYDRKGALRKHYDTKLVSETERLRASVTDSGFQIANQKLNDGSLVTPGHDFPLEDLRKNLSRDNEFRKAGYTEEMIDSALSELQKKFEEADIGEEVACGGLPFTVVKRSEELHVEATPKSKPAIERAIGKIAYEFLFTCFGKRLIESAPWIADLRNLVCGTGVPPTIRISRSESIDREIRMIHSIYVYLHPSCTKVAVGLFGGVEYTLIAPPVDPSVMDDFTSQTGLSDVVGIAFQQDLAEGKKHYFALPANGPSRYLGEL